MERIVAIIRMGSRNARCLFNDGTNSLVSRDIVDAWIREHGYIKAHRMGNRWIYRGYVIDAVDSTDTANTTRRSRRSRMQNMTFETVIPNFRFGVEFEFVGECYRDSEFVARVQELGYEIRNTRSYTHNNGDSWILGRDGSISTDSDNCRKFECPYQYELTSPIFTFDEESKTQIANVLNLVTEILGGVVNRSCGTHVHISGLRYAGIRERQTAIRLSMMYGNLENVFFDRLQPPSRRNNRFCGHCSGSVTNRYCKLNLTHFSRNSQRVEFRQQSGTLEINKIWNWIEICSRFVVWFGLNTVLGNEISTPDSFESTLDTIGIDGDLRDWAISRESVLSQSSNQPMAVAE